MFIACRPACAWDQIAARPRARDASDDRAAPNDGSPRGRPGHGAISEELGAAASVASAQRRGSVVLRDIDRIIGELEGDRAFFGEGKRKGTEPSRRIYRAVNVDLPRRIERLDDPGIAPMSVSCRDEYRRSVPPFTAPAHMAHVVARDSVSRIGEPRLPLWVNSRSQRRRSECLLLGDKRT